MLLLRGGGEQEEARETKSAESELKNQNCERFKMKRLKPKVIPGQTFCPTAQKMMIWSITVQVLSKS